MLCLFEISKWKDIGVWVEGDVLSCVWVLESLFCDFKMGLGRCKCQEIGGGQCCCFGERMYFYCGVF